MSIPPLFPLVMQSIAFSQVQILYVSLRTQQSSGIMGGSWVALVSRVTSGLFQGALFRAVWWYQSYLSITPACRVYWRADLVLRTGWGFCSILQLCVTGKSSEWLMGLLFWGESPSPDVFWITWKLTVSPSQMHFIFYFNQNNTGCLVRIYKRLKWYIYFGEQIINP